MLCHEALRPKKCPNHREGERRCFLSCRICVWMAVARLSKDSPIEPKRCMEKSSSSRTLGRSDNPVVIGIMEALEEFIETLRVGFVHLQG